MTLVEYQTFIGQLPFGKRLPTAMYVYWGENAAFGVELNHLVAMLAARHELGEQFNVIKFRTDELKISFLSYPRFMEEAHPMLRHAVTIDLVTGKARHTDYSSNHNPPILHRKETFLPINHPVHATFEALTRAEEAVGLYAHTATIGFKLNWEQLLAKKGVRIEGHTLLKAECEVRSAEYVGAPHPAGGHLLSSAEKEAAVIVDRHKTALTRYDLSKPVKTLLEYGMLKRETTFFDYGSGQGSDMRGLQALGYQAEGWDPVHRIDVAKHEADIVNMGYVLNVIEKPAERVEALVDAHRHAKKLLVVAGLINETVDTARARQFGDGFLTRANTFQKFYEQQELQQYIEDALDSTAVPVALGVFYVFRDPADQQDFLSARSRRTIDWTQISARLGLGGPRTLWKLLYEEHKEVLDTFGPMAVQLGRIPGQAEYNRLDEVSERLGSAKRALRAYVQGSGVEGLDWDAVRVQFGIGQPAKRRWEILYEEHRELLDAYWSLMLQLGRLPEPEEFPQTGELREKVGSPNRARQIFIQKGGGEDVKRAAENRRRELVERGLEIAKECEEFQLGFEALEMEDVAPETGKGLLLKWGSLFAFTHGRSM